jgi:uncharacterized coiled-coil protein SlyX
MTMEKIDAKLEYILKELQSQGGVLIALSKSFNEFRNDFDGTITTIMQEFKFQREYMDGRFDTIEGRLGNIEERLGTVEYDVAMIQQTMATKIDIEKIDSHIGNMERRFQNVEGIVLKDHRLRIRTLEKAVGVGI